MLDVIGIMVIGMIAGYFLREKKRLLCHIDKAIMVSIFLLLFFLGVSVGLNKDVVSNMHFIGLKAFLITLSAVAGSLMASSLVYMFFFKERNK